MTTSYRTPGVYFEWRDIKPVAIERLRTDVAGFVGIAARGPLHSPVKVESWTQFVSTFGAHIPRGYLAYAAEGFFENGGRTCWIVRVADGNLALPASKDLLDGSGIPALRLTATSPGVWGQDVTVSLARTGEDCFSLTLRYQEGIQELWRNLSMDANSQRYVVGLLNDRDTGSRLVTALDLNSSSGFPGNTPSTQADNLRFGMGRLSGGRDGLAPSVDLADGAGDSTLRFTVRGARALGDAITAAVAPDPADSARFSLVLQSSTGQSEKWPSLSMNPEDEQLRYVEKLLNDRQSGSKMVTVMDLYSPAGFPGNLPVSGTRPLTGGLTPGHLSGIGSPQDARWGLAALEPIDEVSIVAIPDVMPKRVVSAQRKERQPSCDVLDAEPAPPPADDTPPEFPQWFNDVQIAALQAEMIGHCELLKDRVAVLDFPPADPTGSRTPMTPLEARAWRRQFDSRYAAVYYPWLKVPDPLALEGLLRDVPPSGYVAGIYARGDNNIGVHKPPANEALRGTKDILTRVGDITHGMLNDAQVNVIKPFNGRGIRIYGARTVSSDAEWRFVNVRRLLIMIEKAIEEATQWTVFEPNNRDLWREVDRVARNFLNDLWRQGMLDGATADEAYFVKCDETTNPYEETEAGRLTCLIGVQPPWPAEFVVVRIGRTEGATEIVETGGRNG